MLQSPASPEKTLSADRAREFLAAAIRSGRIAPSEKIRIKTIADELDVSLGAVREALSRLSAEGFVTALPQKGFCAAPISRADLSELTEARIEIESICIRKAIEKADLNWESELAAAYHALSRTPETDNGAAMSADWTAAHARFHDAVAAGCDNRWLLGVRSALYAQSERYRLLSFPLSRKKRNIAGEHEKIFKAVMDGDSESAEALMAAHLFKTTELILRSDFLDD